MKKMFLSYGSALALFLLVALAAWVLVPEMARSEAEDSALHRGIGEAGEPSASTSPDLSMDGSGELWRLGVTSAGTANYEAILGRSLHMAAAFRSAEATHSYYIFPAPLRSMTIRSAGIYILERDGAYAGTATIDLVIYDYAGTLQHVVSAAGIDAETADNGGWIAIPLSETSDDLVIEPGEFLAARFSLSAAAGDDLDIRPLFEVEVE